MNTGKINIIGIGPGNSKEYLTLKAFETIKSSDIGIYVGEMIGEDIKKLFADKAIYVSINISINEIQSIIELGYKQGKIISLMMPGDASIFSGQFLKQFSLAEYIEWFESQRFSFEVIPGITSWMALNAKINLDITSHVISNNIYITSILWEKELEQFDIDKFESMISTKPCIVLYQSYEKWIMVKHIIEKFYPPYTKIIFAYKLSWEDENIIQTTLSDSDNFTNKKNLSKHTLILILPE